MGKNTKSIIKKNALLLKLKLAGIKRVNPEAINLLEMKINLDIDKLAKVLKERMTIKGRRTLLKEDMRNLNFGEKE